MKQTITQKQCNELSERGKKIMKSWLEKKNYFMVRILGVPKYEINIGIMIEFLDEYGKDKQGADKYFPIERDKLKWNLGYQIGFGESDKELCDALWSACKEVLKK